MEVGSLGAVIFQVSDKTVRTWQQFSRSRKARYATHDIIDARQVLQFTGLDLIEVSLSVRLVSDVPAGGVSDPVSEIKALAGMVDSGRAYRLIIGGKPLGHFVVESLDETIERHDGLGRPTAITAQLKLKEYH